MTYHERQIAEHGYCPSDRPCDECLDDMRGRIADRLRAVMPVSDFAVVEQILREEVTG